MLVFSNRMFLQRGEVFVGWISPQGVIHHKASHVLVDYAAQNAANPPYKDLPSPSAWPSKIQNCGFTLLEVLIALFIFTLVSMMLTSALHTVITAQSVTESKAEQFRQLQMALLLLSRDVEQAVNRPVRNTQGKDEPAFIGSARRIVFTHQGAANLMRTGYACQQMNLYRETWPSVDAAADTLLHRRLLLNQVAECWFDYLDQEGRWQKEWPIDSQTQHALPRAVRISLTLPMGKMSQLYVLPVS